MLRSAILRGPATITFGNGTFYSKGDISCVVDEEVFEILTSMFGVVDSRMSEREGEISFEPVGEWEVTGINELWTPYATMKNGTGIFGTDKPLVLYTQDGKKITFGAAAVTKLPDIILSAKKTMIGSVTFTAIGKENTSWDTADSFVKVESGATPPAAALDPAIIWTAPWTAAWGGSPFAAIDTVDGWVINFDLKVNPFEVDSVGTLDYTFDRVDVIAKCKPVAIAEDQIVSAMGIQGTGARRGRSLQAVAGANDLVFQSTGAAIGLTVYKPAPRKTDLVFGATANRLGETEWIATRKLVGGVMQPLFAFT